MSQQNGVQVYYQEFSSKEKISIDEELVLEVYENLISNAIRYAKNEIKVCIQIREDYLELMVEDDGNGFSEEALKRAMNPFTGMRRSQKPILDLACIFVK